MRTLSEPAKGHLAMLSFSLGVAGSFSLGSQVANDIDPIAITAARFAGSAVLLAILAAIGSGFSRQNLNRPWRYAIAGALMATYFVLMFEGLKTASAVSTSAVFTLTPVMSAIFGWLLLRQVTTSRTALALAVGAAGALWVIFRADFAALMAFQVGTGELIFFAGCIAHAFYTPYVRSANRGESPQVFVFGMSVFGTLLLALYGWEEIRRTDWGSLSALVWATIAYLIIVSTTLTFWLVNFAALRLPAAKVMAYTYLTPTWVLVWESAFGHGLPRLAILVGIVATIVALLMLLKQDKGA